MLRNPLRALVEGLIPSRLRQCPELPSLATERGDQGLGRSETVRLCGLKGKDSSCNNVAHCALYCSDAWPFGEFDSLYYLLQCRPDWGRMLVACGPHLGADHRQDQTHGSLHMRDRSCQPV